MARIRTIKPEFWDSPSVKGSSPWARLLFIAMWNWADDHGRGTANLKELEGFAFPNDYEFWDSSGNTVHFRDLVAEVSERFGVLFYTVNNRPYYEIPSWDNHQRNERRSKASKHPSPQVSDPVAETPCKGAETPNISGAGTGEQGNRGTVLNTLEQPAVARAPKAPNRFEEFWQAYPRKVDKKKAKDAFDVATKTVDPEIIIAGAMRHAADPNRTDQFTKHPTTWLRAGSWDNDPLPARNDTSESQAMKNARSIQQRFHQPQALDEPWLIGGPNGNPERN